MDQLPLKNFENSRIELLVWFDKTLLLSLLSKVGLLWGEWLWEKGGVFEIFDQFLLEQLSFCLNKCV
jgi:hypothetical protein